MNQKDLSHLGVIVQARAMSERFPEKIFLPLGERGRTVLEQVIRRLEYFINRKSIIVATSRNISDDRTEGLCQQMGVFVFRGAEDNVLDRYYQVAKIRNLDHIMRICADSPLIDPDILKQMLEIYAQGSWDYVSNTLEDTYPEGLNAEIFSFRALEKAWIEAKLPSEKEHVTPFIKKGDFLKYSMTIPISSCKDKRWTLDYEEDYHLLQLIYEKLENKQPYFTMQDVLSLLKEYPEWENLNRNIPRNEGYQKSLDFERIL